MNSYYVTDSATATTGIWSNTGTYVSSAGTHLVISEPEEPIKYESKKGIVRQGSEKYVAPGLAFRFIKHKLAPAEVKVLKARLEKLKKLIVAADETGQKALFERFIGQLAACVREQEALAAGYGRKVSKALVDKYAKMARDPNTKERVVRTCSIEDFPRTIPKAVRDHIKDVRGKSIFDDFVVYYTDYSDEAPLKTSKQRIKEKDPILFGVLAHCPGDLFFVTDWTDKYCDLTLDGLVEAIRVDDPEFELDQIPEPNEEYVLGLLALAKKQMEREKTTAPRNFRDQMAEDDRDHAIVRGTFDRANDLWRRVTIFFRRKGK